MIREIKYVCSSSVNYFTCHSLFSKITNCALSKINNKIDNPKYKISFQDRVITIIIDDATIEVVKELPNSLDFLNEGKIIKSILLSNNEFVVKNKFKNDDFVFISGVISYAKHLTKPLVVKSQLDNTIRNLKHKSPITFNGTFVENERQSTLEYLEKRLGIGLKNNNDQRDFRFERLDYKQFELKNTVYSKSNNKRLSIHNVFYFEINGFVNSADVINELEYNSIGKKRSYGFGNIDIRKIINE